MRIVQPRQPWQLPIAADALVCSAVAHSRHASLDAEGAALRSALVDRIVALDVDDDAAERLARLDALPDDVGWSRWQTVVFAGKAWDDDRAIDLAFAVWDSIGEATYREVIRGEHRRPTAAERYAWPGVTRSRALDEGGDDHARVRPVDVGRWVVRDLPLARYADLDTDSMGARARLLAAVALLLGGSAGVGAGIAALLGRSVETGAGVGAMVGCAVVAVSMLLMLSLVVGSGLMSMSRTLMRIEVDQQTRSRRHGTVAWLWVGAAFVGIVTAVASGTLATMWFQERPYQGSLERSIGTVVSWDDRALSSCLESFGRLAVVGEVDADEAGGGWGGGGLAESFGVLVVVGPLDA